MANKCNQNSTTCRYINDNGNCTLDYNCVNGSEYFAKPTEREVIVASPGKPTQSISGATLLQMIRNAEKK